MTAPVHPGGERWIVDGGDGCTTEFATEAEAVAYADACIQDWCDEGWMEEVDNIFVARLTHRSQRHVVAVQGEVSDEEWERVTHGGSSFSEWWEYAIEPLGSTPQAPTVDSVPEADDVLLSLADDVAEVTEARRIYGRNFGAMGTPGSFVGPMPSERYELALAKILSAVRSHLAAAGVSSDR